MNVDDFELLRADAIINESIPVSQSFHWQAWNTRRDKNEVKMDLEKAINSSKSLTKIYHNLSHYLYTKLLQAHDYTESVNVLNWWSWVSIFGIWYLAKHNLSQCAVDKVVSSTEVLFERHLSFFKAQLKSKLSEMHVNPSVVDVVPVSSFLSEFRLNGKRIAHYRKYINTYIEPEEVVLGYKFVSKNGGITRSPRLGYIIPFERSIHNWIRPSPLDVQPPAGLLSERCHQGHPATSRTSSTGWSRTSFHHRPPPIAASSVI